MTRAKFVCTGADEAGTATLTAVVGGSEENDEFFQYTPCGEISLNVNNDNVKFVPGQEYYVDFTEVPKAVNDAESGAPDRPADDSDADGEPEGDPGSGDE